MTACGSVVGRQRRLAASHSVMTMPAWSVSGSASRTGQPWLAAAAAKSRDCRISTLVSRVPCTRWNGTGSAPAARAMSAIGPFPAGLITVGRWNPPARQTTAEGRQPPAVSGFSASDAAIRPPRDHPASTNSPSRPVVSRAGWWRANPRAKSSEASRCARPPSGASDSQSGTITATPSPATSAASGSRTTRWPCRCRATATPAAPAHPAPAGRYPPASPARSRRPAQPERHPRQHHPPPSAGYRDPPVGTRPADAVLQPPPGCGGPLLAVIMRVRLPRGWRLARDRENISFDESLSYAEHELFTSIENSS